jgi:hypothetical protein
MLNAQTELNAVRQTVDAATPLPAIVDELAEVQTLIAVLEAREKNLKAALIASGLSEVCGSQVRARISEVSATITTDYRSLCDYLKPDAATVALFGKKKAGYTAVKLYGFN